MTLLCTTVILGGCALGVGRYTASPENALIVRDTQKNIALGVFTGKKGAVFCDGILLMADSKNRGAENKDAYALYIRQAFEQELSSARINPGLPSLMVSLKLLNVDVSCVPVIVDSAHWVLEAEVTVEGRAPYVVRTQIDIKHRGFSTTQEEIVDAARTSFPKAVQTLVASIMTHPTFVSAFHNNRVQTAVSK